MDADVIVVGAGLAGLVAVAAELRAPVCEFRQEFAVADCGLTW
jgi:monoamine oxidase